MKYINIDTDDKIKAKINNVRITVAKLGNIVPKKDKDDIRKELYKIEKKLKEKKHTKIQKEKIYNHLIEIANILDKTENHKYHDYDDLDHFGTRDIENLFTNIDDADYYKPILV